MIYTGGSLLASSASTFPSSSSFDAPSDGAPGLLSECSDWFTSERSTATVQSTMSDGEAARGQRYSSPTKDLRRQSDPGPAAFRHVLGLTPLRVTPLQLTDSVSRRLLPEGSVQGSSLLVDTPVSLGQRLQQAHPGQLRTFMNLQAPQSSPRTALSAPPALAKQIDVLQAQLRGA